MKNKAAAILGSMLLMKLLSTSSLALDGDKIFENTEVLLMENKLEKSYALITPKGKGAVLEVKMGNDNGISSISASTVRSPTASATITHNAQSNTNRIQLFLSNAEGDIVLIDLNGNGSWDIRTQDKKRSIFVGQRWVEVDAITENMMGKATAEIKGRKFVFEEVWIETEKP